MFEWDAAKALENVAKHGVSFELAVRAFEGPMYEMEDNDPDEDRVVAYGAVEGVVFAIVYTYRRNRIRIISARKATPNERKTYAKKALEDR